MQTFVQLGHAELDAVHRDNRKMLRDTLAPGKIEQGRHQLPPGQVARSAEDDEHVWFELIVRIHSRPPSGFDRLPRDPQHHATARVSLKIASRRSARKSAYSGSRNTVTIRGWSGGPRPTFGCDQTCHRILRASVSHYSSEYGLLDFWEVLQSDSEVIGYVRRGNCLLMIGPRS